MNAVRFCFLRPCSLPRKPLPVRAQSPGHIAGTVVDAASGEKLEFVQFYIQALNVGAMSDEEGRFHIQKVPPGTHELKADLIGYTGITQTVTVTAEQTTTVALQMAPSALFLDEVVVTGTAFKESPISLTYAVAVVGRDKMKEQGSPQATDFFKNISASHGVNRRAEQLVQFQPSRHRGGERGQCQPARFGGISDAGADQWVASGVCAGALDRRALCRCQCHSLYRHRPHRGAQRRRLGHLRLGCRGRRRQFPDPRRLQWF